MCSPGAFCVGLLVLFIASLYTYMCIQYVDKIDKERATLASERKTCDCEKLFYPETYERKLLIELIDDLKKAEEAEETCLSEKEEYDISEQRLKRRVQELIAQVDEERKTWAFEKHGYEVAEELLRKQIQDLVAKEKRDSLPTERMYKYAGGKEKKLLSLSHSQELKSVLTIFSESGNLTMSLIHNELFVFNPDLSHLEIRERATLETKSSLKVSNFYSIAGNSFCMDNKYIYVSTTEIAILKFDSDGDIVAKWSTGDIKGRPSLMADCNVAFIPHDGTTRIFIYTPFGDLFRIIQLKMTIGGARLNCAVQLPNGNFVVSYGTDQDKQHGVSLTDSKGNVLKSFGGIKGKGTNRVNGPYDLIVDRREDVFVVDHNNHRIVRLNSDLEYINEMLPAENGLRFPHGAIFDETHGRLFVMGNTWDDTTSSLSAGTIFVYESSDKQ